LTDSAQTAARVRQAGPEKKPLLRGLLFRLLALALPLALVGVLLELGLRVLYRPPISPGSTMTHPTRRYTLRPGHTGHSLDVSFKVSALGIRDDEETVDLSPDTYRVAVFGDSIAFGQGVPTADTFPNVLERMLQRELGRKVQVFNFGIPSYNTAMEYRYMAERFAEFAPHLVMVQYTAENDSIDGGEPSSIDRHLALRMLKDVARGSYSYEWLSRQWQTFKHRRDVPTGDQKDHLLDAAAPLYADDYPGWVRAQQAFADFAAFCGEKRVPLLFAVYVNNSKLGASRETDPMRRITDKVMSSLEASGIEHVVLLDDAFRPYAGREPELWVTRDDRHFSKLAHELSAQVLFEYMMRRRAALVPPAGPAAERAAAAAGS
jgi:hypothetical protein